MSRSASGNVSLPEPIGAPRVLTPTERDIIAAVADTLIPARGPAPAASAEPGFWEQLSVALDARSRAFADVTAVLAELDAVNASVLWDALRTLDRDDPTTFQALSAIVAGAWLLTPGTRERIGYHGQVSERAGLEEAVDEITSGILEPVIERAAQGGSRWIR